VNTLTYKLVFFYLDEQYETKTPSTHHLGFLFELGHTQVAPNSNQSIIEIWTSFWNLPVPPLAMHLDLFAHFVALWSGKFGVDYNYSSKYEHVILLGTYFVVLVLHFIKPLGEHNYPEIGIFFLEVSSCPFLYIKYLSCVALNSVVDFQ
jgi:hypothetical protein